MFLLKSIGRNQRIIHWWLGTDALKLTDFPPTDSVFWWGRIIFERILWKAMEPLIKEHWIDHERLRTHLIEFGIDNRKIKVVPDALNYGKYKKKSHKGVIILYYFPKVNKNRKYKEWKYGYDYFLYANEHFARQINWIVVDGSQDMSKIFPIVDGYLRPSRHDGGARLVKECRLNQIPVYFPEDGQPHKREIVRFIDEIIRSKA